MLGLALAAGPALADVQPVATTAPLAAPAPAPAIPIPPRSVWRPGLEGAFEHLQSGLVCPGALAGYRLTAEDLYDGYGLDASCNYAAPGADVTTYLTRRGASDTLDGAMAQARAEFLQVRAARHRAPLGESRGVEDTVDWRKAVYATDNDLRDGIWIADLHGWTLEYRTTWVAAADAKGLADLKIFTAQVPNTAGARLAICEKVPPPAREGTAMTDPKAVEQTAMMASILGGAALAAVADGKASSAGEATQWCAEAAMKRGGHDLLSWRGVTGKGGGADAQADRITLMTQEEPPSLEIARDAMGDLVRDARRRKTGAAEPPAHWIATFEGASQTTIFGLYQGRPPVEATADLFEAALEGKARPLGGYEAQGKTITINLPPK